MNDTVKVFCENTNNALFINMGADLSQVAEVVSVKSDYPILAAYVNNTVKPLSFKIYTPVSIRFIDITHFEGMRVYQRTLFFTLQKAVLDLYPDQRLHIKHSVAKGFYCEIDGIDELSEEAVNQISMRMNTLINQDIPIIKERVTSVEAEELYSKLGFNDKVALIKTRPHLYVTINRLANIIGYFYGSLAPSTKYIHLFGLKKYYKGFHIAVPQRTNPMTLENVVSQSKMFDIFNEYTNWVDIIGVANIGALNASILTNKGGELIKIAEAFHEKKLGSIADAICTRHKQGKAKIVLISGPSSSGKTTCAKRLGIQLRILGMRPVTISLDDYFVDRDKTPLDDRGEYDYEALEAINVELFNEHLNRLLAGESVHVPRYDFIKGTSAPAEKPLQLDERSVLVIEGIHGLNPRLTNHIDHEMTFKIYVSAFTSIALDNLNRISTTDSRLIRRIVRDFYTRGNNATDTLRRWGSVRRGEDKYIFPNQEQADVMFNSSLFYELSVLKSYVEPLLLDVPDTVPEYGEAVRLMKFLDQFTTTSGDEIPPTSVLREFIGGSSFQY